MKYLSTIPKTARRVTAVIAAASVAGLIATTAAFAASSSGAALAADTARTTAAAVPCLHGGATSASGWRSARVTVPPGACFYPLQFTNLSRHACAMRGFPGVSAIDRNGHQLGSPAGWNHVIPARTVVLAPGATAHTVLRYSDVAVTTAPGCHPTFSTFELRVYPPGQRDATYAAFDLQACSHAGPVYLDVEPLQPGVGTING